MIFSGYHYFLLNSSYLFLIRSYRFLTIFSFFFSLHRFSLFHRNQCSYYWSWSSLVPRLFVVLTRFTGFFFCLVPPAYSRVWSRKPHTHTGRSVPTSWTAVAVTWWPPVGVFNPTGGSDENPGSHCGHLGRHIVRWRQKNQQKEPNGKKKKYRHTKKKKERHGRHQPLFFGGGGGEILIAIIFEEKRSVGVRRRRSLFGRQDPFFLDRKP